MGRLKLQNGKITLGQLVQFAIQSECSALKAGNVHPNAAFHNMSYSHFVDAAIGIGECVDQNVDQPVGALIVLSVSEMLRRVPVNTSLGTILLLMPLVHAHRRTEHIRPEECDDPATRFLHIRGVLKSVLEEIDREETRKIYEAILMTKPGGLNSSQQFDVHGNSPDSILEAMRLAAEWDDIALQYVSDFDLVFQYATRLNALMNQSYDLLDAIRLLQIEILAARVDSLIVRKCGHANAVQVKSIAQQVLNAGSYGDPHYELQWEAFDHFLRDPLNRCNPGTTADLLAAAIFEVAALEAIL